MLKAIHAQESREAADKKGIPPGWAALFDYRYPARI